MQITVVDIDYNILLNEYVYPYDNRIDCSNIHGIDADVLTKNNALTTSQMLEKIKNILQNKYNNEDVYFIAYNNFGYDQIILENNFKICNIEMPFHWYFTDIYPLIKELYPNMKPNYKLKTVHEIIVGDNNSNISYHTSIGDVLCMYDIYKKIESMHNNNIDSLLEKYTRSLLQSEKINDYLICVIGGGTRNRIKIGDMMNFYKDEFHYNVREFENYLTYNLKIENAYIMIKQIMVIKNFLKKS